MKNTMYWLMGLLLLLALLLLAVKLLPKGQSEVGLIDSQLMPCPDTPNCVCSEYQSHTAHIEPFVFKDGADSAWLRAKKAVIASGGRIETHGSTYLLASYTTKWLGFVDDLELRMDRDKGVIHVRSASRLGRSDFGVNRARVESLRMSIISLSSHQYGKTFIE